MTHPKRAVTRDIRTRRPKRPGRSLDEVEALTWPDRLVRVRELMTRPAATIGWNATIGAAWKVMRTRRMRHLPVLDGGGRLVGIVTDRDLREVILEPSIQEQLGNVAKALNVLTVKEVMTWGVLTVRPDSDVRQAARILRDQKIGALPVVEGSQVVGILTGTDVFTAFVALLDEGVVVSKPERWRRAEG